jgi:hypothetical protein
VRGEFRFAHQVANAFTAAQPPGAMNQFPHAPRLSVRSERCKFAGT